MGTSFPKVKLVAAREIQPAHVNFHPSHTCTTSHVNPTLCLAETWRSQPTVVHLFLLDPLGCFTENPKVLTTQFAMWTAQTMVA